MNESKNKVFVAETAQSELNANICQVNIISNSNAEAQHYEGYFNDIIDSSQCNKDELYNLSLHSFERVASADYDKQDQNVTQIYDEPAKGIENNSVERLTLDEINNHLYDGITRNGNMLDMEDLIDKFITVNGNYGNDQEKLHNKPVAHLNDGLKHEINHYNTLTSFKTIEDVIYISSDSEEQNVLDNIKSHDDLKTISINLDNEGDSDNIKDIKERDTTFLDTVFDTRAVDKNGNSKLNIDIKTCHIDEDSCGSYNSKDFEFITEEEAHRENLKTDNLNDRNPNTTLRTIEVTQDSAGPSNETDLEIRKRKIADYRKAIARFENYAFNLPNVTDRSYRNNHVIPEGDSYLNLFQGAFAPTVPYMIEHKSTRSSSYVPYEGIGFDMRAARGQNNDSEDEFKEEAEESAKKILNMYPNENRKRQRRL